MSSNTFLKITIEDINDHSPMFPKPILDMLIPESAPVNTTFYVPLARDKDTSEYGVAYYELETNTQGEAA